MGLSTWISWSSERLSVLRLVSVLMRCMTARSAGRLRKVKATRLSARQAARLTRKPSTSKPSSTWVTAVFSGESVNCMCSRMNPAVCSLIAWAWASVPRTSTIEVIRVADHSIAGAAPGPITCALAGPAPRRPCGLEVTVEYREGDVSQQGRECRSLWRARWRRGQGTMLAHDPCGEEATDQCQDALVGHPAAHLVQHEPVPERSETVLDVSLDHPRVRTRGVDEEPRLFDGILGSASGPKSVRGRAEVRLEDRLEHELGRRLHDPVAHRRDAQPPELPRPLRDQPLTRRQRTVTAVLELLTELGEDTVHADLLDSRAGLAIDTGGLRPPVAFHPFPRDQQRRAVADQIEQVTET